LIAGFLAQLERFGLTTENRGVPGSSPGLAIKERPAKSRFSYEVPRDVRSAQTLPSAFSCLFSTLGGSIPSAARAIGHRDLRQAMHDPVDIRRRIDRVFARVDRRDDYGQL
jgi:hypothetical protein